jgi:hypothetical protein
MNPTSRWRAALNLRLLNDIKRTALLAAIQKVAPQGALMQNPTIAASYASLSTKGTTFVSSVAVASAAEQQWKASSDARDVARVGVDLELTNFKTLVENNATSAADLTAMGLTELVVAKSAKTVPDAPGAVLVRTGKVHGKARVSVEGKGYIGSFVAQVSTDPIGPATWTGLPGNGKSRLLSGYASGTKLWVQFAQVRWGLQSPWSAAVMVIIP